MSLNIGENIKSLRAEKGATQEQLAEHLSITYQSVSKWENNITAPDLQLIPMIAEFFGVSINTLFKAKKDPNDVLILVNPVITEEQLWRFYSRNDMYEAQCFDRQTAAIPLRNSSLIIAAFYDTDLVGIIRVIHDGLDASVREFSLDLDLQRTNKYEVGALIESDPHGIAKKMGEAMIRELKMAGVGFLSYVIVDGVENALAEAIGLEKNNGHVEYIWDTRG